MPIAPHALVAFVALAAGGIQLASSKGTKRHCWLGHVWCVMMFFVAVSGFFIHSIRSWGLLCPFYLLSVLTIALLARAIWCARSGHIRQHQRIMANLLWLAMEVTGVFTIFPWWIMFTVVSG